MRRINKHSKYLLLFWGSGWYFGDEDVAGRGAPLCSCSFRRWAVCTRIWLAGEVTVVGAAGQGVESLV